MFHTNAFNSLEGLHKTKKGRGRLEIESNYQRSSQHEREIRLSQVAMVETTKGSNSRDTGNMTISANSSRAKNVFPMNYGHGRNLFNIKIEDRNQFIVKQQQLIGGDIFGGGPRVLKSQSHGMHSGKKVTVERVTSKTKFSVKPPFLQDYITSFKQLELQIDEERYFPPEEIMSSKQLEYRMNRLDFIEKK